MSFDELYENYGGNVLNLAYKMTGAEETARDLTQDIFLKVYQNLSSFKGESHIYTWLYRISLNHIINYLKRERRFRWMELMDTKISEIINQAETHSEFGLHSNPIPPDRGVEKMERERIVWSIILKLPEKQRVPLILHRYEGFSYQEIADQLGISLSNVESRIHRAKNFLIKKLEPWIDKI
jgi:RNA polymerase sigma-70 factor (ECF subfamily)